MSESGGTFDLVILGGGSGGYSAAIRASEHNTGKYPNAWTAKRLPVKLVWCCEYQRITDAIEFEQRIKRWTRAKKEAVIRGEWDKLPDLAKAYARKMQAKPTANEPALSLAPHGEQHAKRAPVEPRGATLRLPARPSAAWRGSATARPPRAAPAPGGSRDPCGRSPSRSPPRRKDSREVRRPCFPV